MRLHLQSRRVARSDREERARRVIVQAIQVGIRTCKPIQPGGYSGARANCVHPDTTFFKLEDPGSDKVAAGCLCR